VEFPIQIPFEYFSTRGIFEIILKVFSYYIYINIQQEVHMKKYQVNFQQMYIPIQFGIVLGGLVSSIIMPSILFLLIIIVADTLYTIWLQTQADKSLTTHQLCISYFVSITAYSMIILNAVFNKMVQATGMPRTNIFIIPTLLLGIIIAIYLFSDMKTKEEYICKQFLGEAKNQESPKDLDVKICTDIETQKPVYWRTTDRFLHMLLIGATGVGKTSQVLLPISLQDIQKNNRSIIVLEPKGDFAEKVYALATLLRKKAMYFNPRLPDCPSFNPFYGEEDAVVENMCKTFNTLNKSKNMYFQVMAENLLRYGLKVLKRLEEANMDYETGISSEPATLIRFNILIHDSNGEGKKMVQKFRNISGITPLEKKENADIAAWFLDDYYQPNSKAYEDTSIVRAQMVKLTSNKYLRRVLNPENGISDIMFDKILEEDIVVAIGTEQGLLQDLGAFLGYFLILSYQSSVLRRGGTEKTRKPNIFICDEFQKYADIGFSDILTQGRSYRVNAILATQSRAQIGMNMDSNQAKSFIEVVSTNARNVILFPGASIEDVEYFSKKFGTIKKVEVRKGTTTPKFNMFAGSISAGTNSIQESEKEEAEHSVDSLEFKEFGELTYQIVYKNTLQRAREGRVAWIPEDINNKMEQFVEYYRETQEEKSRVISAREDEEKRARRDSVIKQTSVKSTSYVKDAQGSSNLEDSKDILD